MSDCEEKPPCDNDGECCKKKKEQVEKCCPDKKGCPDTQFSSAKELTSHANVSAYHGERAGLSRSSKKQKGKIAELSEADCYFKRKCILHPYKDTEGEPSSCCQAQSGHHIVPDSAMRGSGYCYSRRNALTVCVAGSGNRIGNHGRIHFRLCKKIQGSGKIPFSELLDAGVEAAKEVLSDSGCDWSCLKKEIDENHKNMSRTSTGKKRKGCKALSGKSKVKRKCGIASPGDVSTINARLKNIRSYVNL